MRTKIPRNLYWILPIVIVIIGLGVLLRENYLQVAEPPSKDSSDALFSGTTDIKYFPINTHEKKNTITIPRIENNQLAIDTYNDDFSLINESNYSINIDKYMSFYILDDSLIYFSKNAIYDENNKQLINDVDEFYPQNKTMFYTKNDSLYELTLKNKKSKEILQINDKEFSITSNESDHYILTYAPNENYNIQLDIHKIESGHNKTLNSFEIPMKAGRKVSSLAFDIKDKQLALAIQTKERQAFTSSSKNTHLLNINLSKPVVNELNDSILTDPLSGDPLTEISDITPRFIKNVPHFLFQAIGETDTLITNTIIADNVGFNIYDGIYLNKDNIKAERRSNTPGISSKPKWIDNSAIAWLEPKANNNSLYIASNKQSVITKANKFNQDYFLHALGKTLVQSSVAILMVWLTIIWIMLPGLFIIYMYVFHVRTIDKQPTWIFYTGIAIYLAGALIFKDDLYKYTVYINGPDYLTFAGSPYVYILLFAIFSFMCAQFVSKYREWEATMKLTYFVGIHLLMMMTFIFPYIL